ncbi:Nicotinamide/nicotinic acid mononucleotide adenylyltransferase [Camellia lanceoleosa]|uniref:Nicotinamide/nicotinic acid mononucleotide adenylyltransferase n=1 Tax=Camellia lanceoleosa TaxID=1840588 RepID=A0ACC0IZP2_9ERIC|nr:Nicotinamide/nicotinic acid mononucleotide adenylyltransferase [Camellia lanceoleosa]
MTLHFNVSAKTEFITTASNEGTWVSMGVYSDGSYGIQPGLIYSFPITCEKGDWSIVQDDALHCVWLRNNYNNDKFVNEFGLRVKTELTSIDARVLPNPMLKYQGTQEVPRVGCWNMIDKKMVNGGKVEFWTCVSFSRLRQNESLISAKHRIEMCHLACRSLEFIMVDPWEASQDIFQRTLTVLCRIKSSLCDSGRISGESLKVMLVCGSDLLESFSIPGAWIPETICRDFGVVCIHRERQDIEKVISNDDILNEYKTNIKVVDELVPN